MGQIKLTSDKWESMIPEKYRLKILDPDGWDRKNFDYSFYIEKISFEEFLDRTSSSTISCNISFFDDMVTNSILES